MAFDEALEKITSEMTDMYAIERNGQRFLYFKGYIIGMIVPGEGTRALSGGRVLLFPQKTRVPFDIWAAREVAAQKGAAQKGAAQKCISQEIAPQEITSRPTVDYLARGKELLDDVVMSGSAQAILDSVGNGWD